MNIARLFLQHVNANPALRKHLAETDGELAAMVRLACRSGYAVTEDELRFACEEALDQALASNAWMAHPAAYGRHPAFYLA